MGGAEIEIDLGAGWTGGHQIEEGPGWFTSRAVLASAVALALLLVPAADLPPPPERLVPVAVLDDRSESFTFLDDVLVAQSGQEITAYDTRTGDRRWRLDTRVAPLALWQTPRWLLASEQVVIEVPVSGSEPAQVEWPSTHTAVIDTVTGERRWEFEGRPEFLDSSLVMLGGAPAQPLQFRDYDTMALRWSIPRPLRYVVDEDRAALYSLDGDEVFTERDLATGAVRRTGRVPYPGRKDDLSLSVVDGMLLVESVPILAQNDSGDRPPPARWYDLATLRPGTAPPWPYRYDCGPVWCAERAPGENRLGVLDRRTGEHLWDVPGAAYLRPGPGGLLLMMSSSDSAIAESAIAIVDERTGATRLDLSGWQAVGRDGRRLWPSGTPGDGQLLMRQDVPLGVTHFAKADASGLRILGTAPFLSLGCADDGRFLACRSLAGKIHLWVVNG